MRCPADPAPSWVQLFLDRAQQGAGCIGHQASPRPRPSPGSSQAPTARPGQRSESGASTTRGSIAPGRALPRLRRHAAESPTDTPCPPRPGRALLRLRGHAADSPPTPPLAAPSLACAAA